MLYGQFCRFNLGRSRYLYHTLQGCNLYYKNILPEGNSGNVFTVKASLVVFKPWALGL